MVIVFVNMVVIGCTDADQQKPSSFLSSFDSYRNICHKIGWEPKCRKQPISGIIVHLYLYTTLKYRLFSLNTAIIKYYYCLIKIYFLSRQIAKEKSLLFMLFYLHDLTRFQLTQLSSSVGSWLTRGMVMTLTLVSLPLQWMACIPSRGHTIQTKAPLPILAVLWMAHSQQE